MCTRLIFTALCASRSTGTAVQFAGDGIGDITEFLFLLFEVFGCGCRCVFFEPVGGFFDGFEELVKGLAMIQSGL